MNSLVARVRKRKQKQKSKTYICKPLSEAKRTQLVKAIDGSCGVKKIIAEKIGKSYGWVYNYFKNLPKDIQDVYDRECERIMDVFEETVIEMTEQRVNFPTALNAAKFGLLHHPKSDKRGYKIRKEVTLEGGKNPIQMESKHLVALSKLRTVSVSLRKQILEEVIEIEEDEGDKESNTKGS